MQVVNSKVKEIMSITAKGYGKRTLISEFAISNRATKGSRICKFKEEDDYLSSILLLTSQIKTLIVNSKLSSLRLNVEGIPTQSKDTIGVQLIKMTGANFVKDVIALEK